MTGWCVPKSLITLFANTDQTKGEINQTPGFSGTEIFTGREYIKRTKVMCCPKNG